MQLSRLLYNYKPSKAIKVIILLVSVGVTSGCFEEDCLPNKSIKLVNASTGECITCFPCLVCTDGTPSVPCGVTVPLGTDIHCAPLRPDPSVVSKASASATRRILPTLAASSVTVQKSSLLIGDLMITAAPTASTTHSAVVATTSFSHPTSSVVYTGSITAQTRKKRAFPQGEIQEESSHTTIYLFSGPFLLVTLIAIVYRMRKKKKAEQLHLPVTTVVTNQEPESSVMSSEQGGDMCTVHPSTITAAYSRSHSKEVRESRMDNDNQHFQPDEADIVSCEAVTIPSSVDVTNTERDQVAKVENQDSKSDVDILVDLSHTSPIIPHPGTEAPKVPQTFNTGTSIVTPNVNILLQHAIFQSPNQLVPQWSNGELDQRRVVNWAALSQEDKYHTKILEVPIPLLRKICLSLDVKRVDGKDAGLLAHKLGLSVRDFGLSQQAAQNQTKSTTYILLSENFHGTVAEFVQIMKGIERYDLICLIDEWNG